MPKVLSVIVLGLCVIGISAAADPPQPIREEAKVLRTESEALKKDRDLIEKEIADENQSANLERIKLRAEIHDLIQKIKDKPAAAPKTPAKTDSKSSELPKKKFESPAGKYPDPMRAALNLYRLEEIDAALEAFKTIDLEKLTPEDRVFVEYMTACCLRRKGKLTEAVEIYRTLANTKTDPFITECSIWQIATLRSVQDLEAQLELLRSKRKTR